MEIITGLIMIVISIVIQAAQFVIEEKIIILYEVSPMRMVGVEGMFGTVFVFIWLMIFTLFDCPCITMCDMTSTMENPISAIKQIGSNPILLMWCLVTIISIALFNLNGVFLTKNVSAIFRAFWDATRTILIWVLSIFFGLEAFVPSVFGIQIVGFILLICGNFIYNEIIELRFWGLNRYLKKNLHTIKRKKGNVKKPMIKSILSDTGNLPPTNNVIN